MLFGCMTGQTQGAVLLKVQIYSLAWLILASSCHATWACVFSREAHGKGGGSCIEQPVRERSHSQGSVWAVDVWSDAVACVQAFGPDRWCCYTLTCVLASLNVQSSHKTHFKAAIFYIFVAFSPLIIPLEAFLGPFLWVNRVKRAG